MWPHLLNILWHIVLPTILFTSIAALMVIATIILFIKPQVKKWPPVIFAFSLLGGLVGIFVGASQEPTTGTVLPAILTFITALLAYLFGKEQLKDWRGILPFL